MVVLGVVCAVSCVVYVISCIILGVSQAENFGQNFSFKDLALCCNEIRSYPVLHLPLYLLTAQPPRPLTISLYGPHSSPATPVLARF